MTKFAPPLRGGYRGAGWAWCKHGEVELVSLWRLTGILILGIVLSMLVAWPIRAVSLELSEIVVVVGFVTSIAVFLILGIRQIRSEGRPLVESSTGLQVNLFAVIQVALAIVLGIVLLLRARFLWSLVE